MLDSAPVTDMNISIPNLSLVVLIGPSGSGKSTFARKHFLPTEALSSDGSQRQSVTRKIIRRLWEHCPAIRMANCHQVAYDEVKSPGIEEKPVSSATKTSARLNFRLAQPLKEVIEEAAAVTGQTVSDFAVSTLVQAARQIVEQRDVTELTNRDRDRFLALLDDTSQKPNQALRDAAAKYRKHLGKKS